MILKKTPWASPLGKRAFNLMFIVVVGGSSWKCLYSVALRSDCKREEITVPGVRVSSNVIQSLRQIGHPEVTEACRVAKV